MKVSSPNHDNTTPLVHPQTWNMPDIILPEDKAKYDNLLQGIKSILDKGDSATLEDKKTLKKTLAALEDMRDNNKLNFVMAKVVDNLESLAKTGDGTRFENLSQVTLTIKDENNKDKEVSLSQYLGIVSASDFDTTTAGIDPVLLNIAYSVIERTDGKLADYTEKVNAAKTIVEDVTTLERIQNMVIVDKGGDTSKMNIKNPTEWASFPPDLQDKIKNDSPFSDAARVKANEAAIAAAQTIANKTPQYNIQTRRGGKSRTLITTKTANEPAYSTAQANLANARKAAETQPPNWNADGSPTPGTLNRIIGWAKGPDFAEWYNKAVTGEVGVQVDPSIDIKEVSATILSTRDSMYIEREKYKDDQSPDGPYASLTQSINDINDCFDPKIFPPPTAEQLAQVPPQTTNWSDPSVIEKLPGATEALDGATRKYILDGNKLDSDGNKGGSSDNLDKTATSVQNANAKLADLMNADNTKLQEILKMLFAIEDAYHKAKMGVMRS